MPEQGPIPRPSSPQRFGCFVLHAHASDEAGGRCLRLVLEDVGTGAKERFASPADLEHYLLAWASDAPGTL